MKFAFITFLIISFVGVAVFGFVSMIFGDTHNGGCIASNRLGAFCPLNSVFDFVVFHIGAFKYFSTAIFVFSFKFPVFLKNKEIIRWLSLHIKSPAFIPAA
ncbi:MAG: hypothetical protein UT16_C0031G0006 [Candidatus Azambacteria bacterium GW2011_GWA2_39_10]|uniref:Uncharacterized protein n=1 Tax=Candidatus Azambacteria bacterium GW2011_GWA2_39_10 TaxID=1618611 RepID=A0A0G0LS00_9BACT|nr:MAG: hypothetical protein UT16_C0031G0006 [Candidatus Azambacteria bacterium GW2011_GWA2_39_10]